MWIVVINAVHGQEISGPFFFNASCEIMFLSSQSVTAPRDLVIAGQIRWPWYALGFLLGNNKCLGNQKLIPQERGKKTCVIATFSDFTLRMMLNSQLGQKNQCEAEISLGGIIAQHLMVMYTNNSTAAGHNLTQHCEFLLLLITQGIRCPHGDVHNSIILGSIKIMVVQVGHAASGLFCNCV